MTSSVDVAAAMGLYRKWDDDLNTGIVLVLSAFTRSLLARHGLADDIIREPETTEMIANATASMREQVDGPLGDVRAWITNAMQAQAAAIDELDLGVFCVPDEGADAERVIFATTNSRGSALPGQRAAETAMGPIDLSLWVKQETRVSGHPVPQNKYNTSGSAAARAKATGAARPRPAKMAKRADGESVAGDREATDESAEERSDEEDGEEDEDGDGDNEDEDDDGDAE